MIDQAREISRLTDQLKIKDQALARSDDQISSLNRQLSQLQNQLNKTLLLIKNENTPMQHFHNAQDLVEKLMLIEDYIKSTIRPNAKLRHSAYDFIPSSEARK